MAKLPETINLEFDDDSSPNNDPFSNIPPILTPQDFNLKSDKTAAAKNNSSSMPDEQYLKKEFNGELTLDEPVLTTIVTFILVY